MKRVAVVVCIVSFCHVVAFRETLAGSAAFFGYLLGLYLVLLGFALHHFWNQGTLLERLAPRWGDLSIGAVSAMALLFASWLGRSVLAPAGTPRQAWLYRLYLQIGDPELLQHSVWLTSALLALTVAEEIVWRGWVIDLLADRIGSRRAWMLSAVLYAIAVSPTLYGLRDPIAGPNPLLATAALGTGLVWGFLAARLGRLPPVAVSHMAFTYFSAVQFRWPGV